MAHASHVATTMPSWLEIDLERVAANVRALRGRLERWGGRDAPQLCGVIKKNAYGLGAPAIAHRLAKAGCDMLAVYAPHEAEQLIADAIDTPILLLMPLRQLNRTGPLYRHAVKGKLHLTAHDPDQLRQINAVGHTFGLRLPVHLFLDTGMSRSGLSPAQLHHALAALPELRFVRCVGICSHLASADEDPAFTDEQRQCFEALIEEAGHALPEGVMRHLANTFATLRDPGLHMDMVRCGIGLLGYGRECMRAMPEPAALPSLSPVLRWLSRLIHVQSYPTGACVGYGATHALARDSVLGIVPVGYGDGYPLGLGNQAQVRLIDDHDRPIANCPVLGRVNMDQIVIDLTDALPDGGAAEHLMHQRVEVISNDPEAPNALPRLAELAGLHPYAMLCRLSPHLPRTYVR